MDKDFTHKINIAKSQTLSATFRLTIEDIEYILDCTPKDKFFINGGYYVIGKNTIEFNPLLKEQNLKLNFELING